MSTYLPYLENDVFEKLLNSIDENSENYKDSIGWLENYFGNNHFYSESTIEVPTVKLEFPGEKPTTEEKNSNDFINARQLYGSYIKYVTPKLATNKYMWTALCHTMFYEYTQKRWNDDSVADRFFCRGSKQSLVYYNSISRLWWAAHLTYNENYSDPYYLTRILFDSGQQTYKDLTDCAYSRNREITEGVILAIKQLKDDCNVVNFGDCFRDFNKYINRKGASTNLDILGKDIIRNIAYDYMKKWQDNYSAK